jgi:hypothetical protein
LEGDGMKNWVLEWTWFGREFCVAVYRGASWSNTFCFDVDFGFAAHGTWRGFGFVFWTMGAKDRRLLAAQVRSHRARFGVSA